MLQPKEEDGWLVDAVPLSTLLSFLHPYPAELIKAYQVSTLVNRASVDQPELIEPER
jgi:putative SOS response-associated peptidase YedK